MSGERLVHKLGRAVTRVLLSPGAQRSRLARAAYARLYLAGKALAERRERAFLRRQVRPGMVVFDIGANLGFYSTFLARLVGPEGRVHAFEPDPFCFGILERRARAHPNLTVAQTALGDHEGRVTLYCNRLNRADNRIHDSLGGETGDAVEVPLTTLDRYCAEHGLERIDALKMDVQGAEVAVLAGMKEVLSRTKPLWLFLELSPDHLGGAGSSPEAFWQVLDDAGYEPFSLGDDGSASPIADRLAFSTALGDGYTDVWALNRAPANGKR